MCERRMDIINVSSGGLRLPKVQQIKNGLFHIQVSTLLTWVINYIVNH